MKTNLVTLKLAYHRPHPNTCQMPFPSMDPIPVFVAEQDFLQAEDFQSTEVVRTGSEFTMRFQLAAGAREKINHLADYRGLTEREAQELRQAATR